MKALELAGEHRGMLKILKRAPRPKGEPKRFSWWLCKCDCGNKVVLSSHRLNVRKSCGCLTIRHGHTGSPTWNSWMSMKHPGPNHSPKNTECCVRQLKYENFLEDMGPRPKGTRLTRLDSRKPFSPRNCRWASGSGNGASKHVITFDGRSQPLIAWCKEFDLEYSTIRKRIVRGWSPRRALVQEVDSQCYSR